MKSSVGIEMLNFDKNPSLVTKLITCMYFKLERIKFYVKSNTPRLHLLFHREVADGNLFIFDSSYNRGVVNGFLVSRIEYQRRTDCYGRKIDLSYGYLITIGEQNNRIFHNALV